MDLKTVIGVVVFLFLGLNLQSQEKDFWNGKKCAVVLTYDDALDSQLDIALPLLDSLGLKATFYLPGKANSLRDRMAEWRSAQAKGHELGNHTLFHPCHGKARNRNWVPKEYNLDNYTVKRITDELKVANTLLHAIDGDTLRTFAYTCGDRTVEGQYFINKMKGVFVAARGVERGLNEPGKMDPYDLKIFGSNSRTEQGALIQQVKKAEKNGALLIFLFHGLGNERKLDTDPARHAELLNYLAKHQKTIWVAPLKEVIQYYKANQR